MRRSLANFTAELLRLWHWSSHCNDQRCAERPLWNEGSHWISLGMFWVFGGCSCYAWRKKALGFRLRFAKCISRASVSIEFWWILDRFGICFSYNLRIPAVSELLPPLRVSHQDLALYHGVSRTAEGAGNLIGIPLLSAAPSAPSVYISSSEN